MFFLLLGFLMTTSCLLAQSDNYSIKILERQEMQVVLPFVAAQRLVTFREYPYLYDGTLEYESAYLGWFSNLPYSAIAFAYQGKEPVGFIAGTAFTDYDEEFKGSVDLFKKSGLEAEKYYYFSEVIVLTEHRGNRLCERLFKVLENYAKRHNFSASCFVTEGYDQHPLKPQNHRSLVPMWKRLGYQQSSIKRYGTWATRQVNGTCKEEEHPLVYWLKDLSQKIWQSVDKRAHICKVDVDSSIFKNLQLCYECEFASITGSKMDLHGNYDQQEIRSHWNKKWDAYVFYVDNAPAGMCVVNHGSVINQDMKNDVNVHDMAEFFIAPLYRKKGYGQAFAEAIFNLHPGQWEVRQLSGVKETARLFWLKVIAKVTNNNFVELDNHSDWEGFVQTFTIILNS